MSKWLKVISYIMVAIIGIVIGYNYSQFKVSFNRTEAVTHGKVTLIYEDGRKERIDYASSTYNGFTDINFVEVMEKLGYVCEKNGDFSLVATKNDKKIKIIGNKAYLNDNLLKTRVYLNNASEPHAGYYIQAIVFYDIIKETEPNITGMAQQFNDIYFYLSK